jgi:hypothetical protein
VTISEIDGGVLRAAESAPRGQPAGRGSLRRWGTAGGDFRPKAPTPSEIKWPSTDSADASMGVGQFAPVRPSERRRQTHSCRMTY